MNVYHAAIIPAHFTAEKISAAENLAATLYEKGGYSVIAPTASFSYAREDPDHWDVILKRPDHHSWLRAAREQITPAGLFIAVNDVDEPLLAAGQLVGSTRHSVGPLALRLLQSAQEYDYTVALTHGMPEDVGYLTRSRKTRTGYGRGLGAISFGGSMRALLSHLRPRTTKEGEQ